MVKLSSFKQPGNVHTNITYIVKTYGKKLKMEIYKKLFNNWLTYTLKSLDVGTNGFTPFYIQFYGDASESANSDVYIGSLSKTDTKHGKDIIKFILALLKKLEVKNVYLTEC